MAPPLLTISATPEAPLKPFEGEGESNAFKVPAGEAPDGRLVPAKRARTGVDYRCPGCATPLILRQGEVRSPHFAHKAHGFCSPETALHQGVKRWVARMLQRCLRGVRLGVPRVRVDCEGDRRGQELGLSVRCPGDAWLPLAEVAFDEVALERTTPDGLRPDVLLLHQGQPVLGIEVLVTHAVDAPKAERSSYPWLEMEAMQVLRSPTAWKPRQQNLPWTGVCRACTWANRLLETRPQACDDLGEYVAQLASAFFAEQIRTLVETGSRRVKPAVQWRCPWCRKQNKRLLQLAELADAGAGSSLVPPCDPEVLLATRTGATISITFGFPRDPGRPRRIVPLNAFPGPALRVTPDPKYPHHLALNGTNRPLAFTCQRCWRDCLGNLPSPLTPVPWVEEVAPP